MEDVRNDYEGFIEKFNPKKQQTTATRRRRFTRQSKNGRANIME